MSSQEIRISLRKGSRWKEYSRGSPGTAREIAGCADANTGLRHSPFGDCHLSSGEKPLSRKDVPGVVACSGKNHRAAAVFLRNTTSPQRSVEGSGKAPLGAPCI